MTITALPTPPAVTDIPADFNTKAFALVAALPTLVTEINAAIALNNITNAADVHAATSKTTLVNADEFALLDSASSYSLKKATWTNVKATLVATALTWSAAQTFAASGIKLLGSSTGATTFTSANASATDYTATFPAKSGTVAMTSDITGGGLAGSFTTLSASGVTSVTNTTNATSISTGSLVTAGGVGITKALYVGMTITASGNITTSGSIYGAAVMIDTGSSQFGSMRYVAGGYLVFACAQDGSQALIKGAWNADTIIAPARNDLNNYGDVVVQAGGGEVARFIAGGGVSISSTTDATSTTAASLKTAGGLAVAKKAYFGDDVIHATKTPASASASGISGTITWDASYVYVCTATNTWKRSAITTW